MFPLPPTLSHAMRMPMMRIPSSHIVAILLVSMLIPLSYTQAAPVGEITRVMGQAFVEAESGAKKDAAQGMALSPGDTLETSNETEVWFEITNIGFFKIGENTAVSVDEYYTEDEEEPSVLRLAAGYLWAKIRAVATGAPKVEIHTPTAIAGVRGTEFEVVAGLDGATAVAVDEGSVQVGIDDEEVVVKKGARTEMEPGGRPRKPFPSLDQKKRDWVGWRAKSRQRLLDNLPAKVDQMEAQNTRLNNRTTQGRARILENLDRMVALIASMKDLRGLRDKSRIKDLKSQLLNARRQFRSSVNGYKKAVNQARSGKRLSHMVRKQLTGLGDAYPAATLESLQSRLGAISLSAENITREAKALRKQIKDKLKGIPKGGPSAKPDGKGKPPFNKKPKFGKKPKFP